MASIIRATSKAISTNLQRSVFHGHRMLASNTTPSKDVSGNPIKFTTSKAAAWNAKKSRGDTADDRPWYEMYVVLSSVTVFMLYFCVLRDENDLDHELHKSLYERIPGLEEKQLEIVLDYNESKGIDTRDIENRLDEIRSQESD